MSYLIEFFKHNYRNNWGLWFHLLVSIIAAKFALYLQFPITTIIVLVLIIAIWWELTEVIFECHMKTELIIQNYGSIREWLYDSIGDILIALIGCLIIVI